MSLEPGFRKRVEQVVSLIPVGRVMTYGQIAALCGSPRAARIVGGIAHYGNPNLPWHRVVNRHGGLASGYPGGKQSQAKELRREGLRIVTQDVRIHSFKEYLWRP